MFIRWQKAHKTGKKYIEEAKKSKSSNWNQIRLSKEKFKKRKKNSKQKEAAKK